MLIGRNAVGAAGTLASMQRMKCRGCGRAFSIVSNAYAWKIRKRSKGETVYDWYCGYTCFRAAEKVWLAESARRIAEKDRKEELRQLGVIQQTRGKRGRPKKDEVQYYGEEKAECLNPYSYYYMEMCPVTDCQRECKKYEERQTDGEIERIIQGLRCCVKTACENCSLDRIEKEEHSCYDDLMAMAADELRSKLPSTQKI